MQITPRTRQAFFSAIVFCCILVGVMSVDERLREQLTHAFDGGRGVTALGDRAVEVGSTIVATLRDQGIDNTPMMVFAVAGVVLFLFMFKA